MDAFAGLRWTPFKTEKWWLSLRGDIGGGESDFVWLASFNAGYRFDKNWSMMAGYRYLDTDYENGGFKWDIAQSGLGIGVVYSC